MCLQLMFCVTFIVLSLVAGQGSATITTTATSTTTNNKNQSWTLIWQDEFNGDHLNTDEWYYSIDANKIFAKTQSQWYTENRTENVRLENGTLVIEVQIEPYHGKQFSSGRITSKHNWKFGRFEARARMPSGHHLFPAIWMMPGDAFYGTWPRSGEIDLVEMRGDKSHEIMTTLHYGITDHTSSSGPKHFGQLDLSEEFHRYSFEWTPTELLFSFDDQPYYKVNLDRMMWNGHGTNPYTKHGQPFDRPFHWILNVAVGGGFFGPPPYVTPDQARHWKKKTMELDYLRIYQLK